MEANPYVTVAGFGVVFGMVAFLLALVSLRPK